MRAALAAQPAFASGNVAGREALLAEARSAEGVAMLAAERAYMDLADTDDVAPSTGLRTSEHEVVSLPDANTIRLYVTRPDTREALACVYYIHGGGMATLSCTYGTFRAFARLVAAQGVCVVMVDFRNCVAASSVPEVAPYPAGLNDCLSGLRWVHAHASELGVDPTRVVVAGESGGGNLTFATAMALKRDGDLSLVAGLYALCPFTLGQWPDERFPSSSEYADLLADVTGNRARVAYGLAAFNARDPLAWPGFATADDLVGLPPTVVSVNEFDPLRDEGVSLYRRLLAAGVDARGRVVLGTTHATELDPRVCPELSRDTARDLAALARGAARA
ncbi:MAG: alpha/beta hydrolase fold domain-containing protein [Acidimicrobiales bacterium]